MLGYFGEDTGEVIAGCGNIEAPDRNERMVVLGTSEHELDPEVKNFALHFMLLDQLKVVNSFLVPEELYAIDVFSLFVRGKGPFFCFQPVYMLVVAEDEVTLIDVAFKNVKDVSEAIYDVDILDNDFRTADRAHVLLPFLTISDKQFLCTLEIKEFVFGDTGFALVDFLEIVFD